MAPKRKSRELKTPKEEKPTARIADIDTEIFQFTFCEEGLTARQCAEKLALIQTKEEFLREIPQDDINRFLAKALIGRRNEPIQCFHCERVYTSASGFMAHLRKCEPSNDAPESTTIDGDSYRASPHLWLKVEAKDRKSVLEQIVTEKYKCFSSDCTAKFSSANGLINHLAKCIKPAYFSFKDRPSDFRQLDKKSKSGYIREAMNWTNGGLDCFVCGKNYSHQYGLIYHIDRCQVEKSEQPWKCYRCGFEGKLPQSEDHLRECAREQEQKLFEKKFSESGLLLTSSEEDVLSSKRRRSSGAPRATSRKDGSVLYRYRKSTVNREFNGIVSLEDQRKYEEACSSAYDDWKKRSDEIPFCERLRAIEKSKWETICLEMTDPLYNILTRQSVTLITEKVDGLRESVPEGVRITARQSCSIEDSKATVAFCGAPINSIKVAPGKLENGDDVICVCTFANETNLESNSSVVQFWRYSNDSSTLELWFLLHLPEYGTVLSMTWLQKHDSSDESLVGFAAFSTTLGEVIVFRIDSSSVTSSGDDVQVVVGEPHLKLGLSQEAVESDGLNATIKQEVDGEEVLQAVKIDESSVPILKIVWSAEDGGRSLVGLSAMGLIVVWNLDEDLEHPRVKIDDSWQSPPNDISFLDAEHLVVGFRERLVKVINVNDWEVKLEENTMKTAGTRVHTDTRILDSFFTFQSEYNSFPYPNATSVAYVKMMSDVGMLVLIPTANTHQLMVWDVAMCPPLGTLVSCGIDGRLVATASGRFLKNADLTFFANRNVMALKRRRVMKEAKSLMEMLKEVKTEGTEPVKTSKKDEKEPLEESLVEHEDVCGKMWLEVSFDQSFEPGRPELSCRDQRIESLNCVDTNANRKCPVSFTGGEAGLLFAVPSKLTIKEMDL